jgi:tetrahydromethanopterin S-methyltransferase subunit G
MSDERLERIEQKLDLLTDGMTTLAMRVDTGFGRLDGKIDASVENLDRKMEAGFQRLERRLDSIEATQSEINSELSDRVEDHEQRIVTLEKKP